MSDEDRAPQENPTKAQASELIDELQQTPGRGA